MGTNAKVRLPINQSVNQSMYFKKSFKLYNLQIYINTFYFTRYIYDNRDNAD